ncbi:MAG: HU family DNA-binding protein [Paramuribaculum sp.]|nr:HU family DNA-binding protein [Paramuribaculum sp.]
MDTKELVSSLSNATGQSCEEISLKINSVAKILKNFCKDLDAIAVPGFGTFQPVKEDEIVVADENGKNTLLPPVVEVTFKSSIILRKALGK